jgi:hypothetical protein
LYFRSFLKWRKIIPREIVTGGTSLLASAVPSWQKPCRKNWAIFLLPLHWFETKYWPRKLSSTWQAN